MARNTPWHADGDLPFSRLTFDSDGHAFLVELRTVIESSRPPAPGQRGEWQVLVDGAEIGRAPAHEDDWERSVYDLALAMWARERGKRA